MIDTSNVLTFAQLKEFILRGWGTQPVLIMTGKYNKPMQIESVALENGLNAGDKRIVLYATDIPDEPKEKEE